MHRSTTSIHSWFMMAYFMTKSKTGISMVEIAGHLGISYGTAFKLTHLIRGQMQEDDECLFAGIIEVDETYVGGDIKNNYKWKNSMENKTIVLGLYQRIGGKVKTHVVDGTARKYILPIIDEIIEKGSTIYTDQHATYKVLPKKGYLHDYVIHKRQWVKEDVTTNRIESFWSYFKSPLRAVHKSASKRYLQNYLDEFAFRYNRREWNEMKKRH